MIGTWRFIARSLVHYRRTHLGLLLGAALTTAVLVGALVVGDSVRYSLRRLVDDRLGRVEFALDGGDRFFRDQLADDLRALPGVETAALLKTRGAAINTESERRANQVQILGVDARFGKLGGTSIYDDLAGGIIINRRLAERLALTAGDELLLRMEKPDALPRDAPLASEDDLSVSRRFRVQAVAAAEQFGRFSLQTNQVEPFTVFIDKRMMGDLLALAGRANLLLIAGGPAIDGEHVESALDAAFRPADASLTLKELAPNLTELRSARIFLDPPIADALNRLEIAQQPVFTYLVNGIRGHDRLTPYSFVSASGAPLVTDLRDDEIMINDWTARDLGVRIGDNITLDYFILGPMRSLVEQSRSFRLRRIVPLSGIYADADLMPDFPGLAGQENCRDWDAGFPIDYDKIRDRDEEYWDDFRGTPKAFVTLKAAQEMWGNRFGDLTAVRFAAPADSLQRALTPLLEPRNLGLLVQPVRQQGEAAGEQSISFSQLFLGLSFFLIVAALLLTGLLFAFSAQQRAPEAGLLAALGFTQARVGLLTLLEGAVVAGIGAMLGVLLGILYHQLVLLALKTIWIDIVGSSALRLHLEPLTLLIGFAAGAGMSLISLVLVARRRQGQSPAALYRGLTQVAFAGEKSRGMTIGGALFVAVIALIATSPSSQSAGRFFLAGALTLTSLLFFADALIRRLGQGDRHLTLAAAGRRNLARHRRSSLTVIGMMAAGVFITFTVGVNRISAQKNADDRASGTGGFGFWGESALPILGDLNSEKSRTEYNMTADFTAVPFRVKEGDDASCLNLHRVAAPRILAVDLRRLDERGAFSFAQLAEEVDPQHPWRALAHCYERDDLLPAIADQTVIQWGLGKQVGDTLAYVDEYGRRFFLRLVGGLNNSIFQGNVIISEERFIERYPSTGGYRVVLIDAEKDVRESVAQQLTWGLQDLGLELTPTVERLAEFNKVTNTYLSIFMILGGLGLLIGSLGIGIIMVRQVMERRNELALMRAVGFARAALARMIFSEYAPLLMAGVIIGAAASGIAALPTYLTPGAPMPLYEMIGTVVLLLIAGSLSLTWASRRATAGDLLPALRNE